MLYSIEAFKKDSGKQGRKEVEGVHPKEKYETCSRQRGVPCRGLKNSGSQKVFKIKCKKRGEGLDNNEK